MANSKAKFFGSVFAVRDIDSSNDLVLCISYTRALEEVKAAFDGTLPVARVQIGGLEEFHHDGRILTVKLIKVLS